MLGISLWVSLDSAPQPEDERGFFLVLIPASFYFLLLFVYAFPATCAFLPVIGFQLRIRSRRLLPG